MVIDYKLPYPSGTATAVLINGFHTSKGDKMARYETIFTILSLCIIAFLFLVGVAYHYRSLYIA